MCSKNKSANSKHNVTSSTRGKFPADSRRDAAEYFMIMRNTDSCGFGGFTSRLLYSSTVQSGVTWQWAELTLSADWTAAPTLGLPSAADWTVGRQDGSMMWCQWKGACFISLTHRGWTRGRHAAKIAHVWQDTSLCGAWLCLWNIIAVLVLHLEMASCYHGNVNCAYWLNVTKQNTPQKYIF